MHGRDNSFDLLRLLAAFGVLWSHQFPLLGLPEPSAQPLAMTIGALSVGTFFAISGYLNTQSLFRGGSLVPFLVRRALRIYPALIVCVGFCIVLGALLTTVSLRDFWSSGHTLLFALKNTTLVAYFSQTLPGVFGGLPYPQVNGSLWTLPYEFGCTCCSESQLRRQVFA